MANSKPTVVFASLARAHQQACPSAAATAISEHLHGMHSSCSQNSFLCKQQTSGAMSELQAAMGFGVAYAVRACCKARLLKKRYCLEAVLSQDGCCF